MDARLRQILSKSAGSYFIVSDQSQVPTIETDPKLRLVFINSDKGPVNILYQFAKGDISGFTSIFGKSTRLQEKKGNFSISTCLEMLASGPIAVINLRAFDNTLDKADILGLNPNVNDQATENVAYTALFNTNKFWSPKPKEIPNLLPSDTLLNFGVIGTNDLSIFVTFANTSDILNLTSQGDKTLEQCTLEIDDYPALDVSMLLKDTFVNVYVFNNSFNVAGVGTNPYYGQYFDNNGNVDLTKIELLAKVPESGYIKKFTGSLIPHLVSETSENISIDDVINAEYMTYGLISHINDELFEVDNKKLLDIYATEFHEDGTKVVAASDYLLSYVTPATLTTGTVTYPLTEKSQDVTPADKNLLTYGAVKLTANSFEGSFGQGLKIGDLIQGTDDIVKITAIETLNNAAVIGATSDTYHKVKYICSGNIDYTETVTGVAPDQVTTWKITKIIPFNKMGLIHPFDLTSYKPRSAQFIDGTATRQKEILDMMNSVGIVKGLKSTKNIRYVVDAFKSFVESSYKYQFGKLMVSLDEGNKFVRAIINEPFLEDLEKSTNPLFKQSPTGVFQWSFLETGGNPTYSTKFLTKFSEGAYMCFFFGPGNVVKNVTRPLAGLVSNLFYAKGIDFDVVANESGYVDNIQELETEIDDEDRAFCEKFRYNPIINFNGGNTIFGNNTGQKDVTSLTQIHNSELLAYIKNSLYNLSKGEAFKKGNYDDYLRTETEAKAFMNDINLAGAIKNDWVVICNESNNTPDIAKQRIKLVHIEYTAVDALEKTVFDLTIK